MNEARFNRECSIRVDVYGNNKLAWITHKRTGIKVCGLTQGSFFLLRQNLINDLDELLKETPTS